MRVESVVLIKRLFDVRDQLEAILTDTIAQVPAAEGTQRQFGLVYPGRMGGREVKRYATFLPGQPGLRVLRDVRRAVVQDAVNAPDRPWYGGQVLVHAVNEVRRVVFRQHPAPQAAGHQRVDHQQIDGTVPLVLPLPPVIVPRQHPQIGTRAPQRLDLRLFVHTDDQFVPLRQPRDPLIVPEYRGRLFFEVRDDGLPPVPEMMRVEIGSVQDAVHRGRMQRGDLAPLNLIVQRLDRPADPRAAHLRWRGAGQGDDLNPLQG